MAGSVVHLLEQPRLGCDRVLPHSPEPGRGAGRAGRNLRPHERVRGECDAKDEGPESALPRRWLIRPEGPESTRCGLLLALPGKSLKGQGPTKSPIVCLGSD